MAKRELTKAAFNAYIEQLERGSKLPPVAAKLREFTKQGNKKAQFEYYCRINGGFQAPEASDEIAELQARIDALQARTHTPSAPRERVRRSSIRLPKVRQAPKASTTDTEVKPAQFRAWAVRKHGIPTKVGQEFTYKGKRRSTKFVVIACTGKGDALVVTADRI